MSKTAFIFPGQGSQYVGMGKDLFLNFNKAKEIFEEASDAVSLDLRKLAFEGPEDKLNLTANTQPAILTTSIAALHVLTEETGLRADILAGHSLGEYTALVHSGVLSFTEAVKIVKRRGELMQEAVPEGQGAMAAILGMEKDEVASICADVSGEDIASPANFNSPGQIVISGHRDAVTKATELAKERGAKRAILLPVSVPSHCSLMEAAGKALRADLKNLSMGDLGIDVISNVEAAPYPDTDAVIDLLVRQLSSPVKWDASIIKLRELGIEKAIEVGPGKVLSGLVKRIDKEIKTTNIEDLSSLKKIQEEKF
ncbi:MAG: ACP S-malonyltransferase [Proteobacteria bacterium]|nr:ACP S-malonyltransferase [Pseudomonadota bacterium]